MPGMIDARRLELRGRLQSSRQEIFHLAHAMKGHEPAPELAEESAESFPQSRLMRALLGREGRMLLGSAAVAVTLLRPKLLLRALRLAPALRPLIMRYLLPRMLGQR